MNIRIICGIIAIICFGIYWIAEDEKVQNMAFVIQIICVAMQILIV